MWNRGIGVEVAIPAAVIPAKAGILGQSRHMPHIRWTPAFAGVTLSFLLSSHNANPPRPT
jgi:hypothetical protein